MIGRQYPAPGVYEQRRQRSDWSLGLVETGIPAFLGMTSRGPMDVPVRVESYDEFRKTFGPPIPFGYLNEGVYGFFSNGGKRCFIIRIAHRRGGGARDEVATKASIELLDAQGRPTLRVEAANEGLWGNQVHVEIQESKQDLKTYLTFDMEKGSTKATVKTTRGFQRGSLVRVYSRNIEHYAVLDRVENKVLVLREEDAVPETLKSSDLIYIEPVTFDLFVRQGGTREAHKSLGLHHGSERFVERFVAEQSDLVRVTLLDNEGPLDKRMPVPSGQLELSGGLDGLMAITPEDFIGMNEGPGHRFGLRALDEHEEVDLIAAPDLMACRQHSTGFSTNHDIEVVQEAMVALCERGKETFAILDVPEGLDIEKTITWRLQFDSAFGAFYYPWIAVMSGNNKRMVPPSAHIAGVYSRCDREAGPHRVAANEVVQSAIHLEVALEEDDIGYLNAHQVNPIRVLPARGIRIWGARTTSSDREWKYVSVRRIVSAVRRTLVAGTQWVVFENNNTPLWRKLERQIKFFLTELHDKGYFAGETPDQSFFVQCDAETNPPARRDAGELVVNVGLAPVRPAEFITFVIEQQLPEVA